jgi:hypothetical protein
VALLALPTSALSQEKARGLDDDFEVDEPSPNLALGPTPRGALISSFGLGWLRSDLVAHVGLGYWLDLTARADSMLLYKGMNAQNGIYGGIRVSPFEGLFRLSLGLEAGEVFIPVEHATKSRTLLRGEVASGVQLERFTVFGRLALQRSRADTVFENRWASETEAGVGLEGRVGRKLLLGAEVYGWGQPKQTTLFQWRLRVGWVN